MVFVVGSKWKHNEVECLFAALPFSVLEHKYVTLLFWNLYIVNFTSITFYHLQVVFQANFFVLFLI